MIRENTKWDILSPVCFPANKCCIKNIYIYIYIYYIASIYIIINLCLMFILFILAIVEHRFSTSCYLDSDSAVTCDQCQLGYTGRQCERSVTQCAKYELNKSLRTVSVLNVNIKKSLKTLNPLNVNFKKGFITKFKLSIVTHLTPGPNSYNLSI